MKSFLLPSSLGLCFACDREAAEEEITELTIVSSSCVEFCGLRYTRTKE